MAHPTKILMLPVLTLGLLAAVTAGGQKKTAPPPPPPPPIADTVPAPAAPTRVRDFDDVRRELDRAQAELQQAMRNLKLPEPPQPPPPPQVDWDKMEQELKAVDTEKIKAQMEEARKQMEQAKQQMARSAKEQEKAMAQVQIQLKEMRPKIEAEMKKAQEQMDKARKEMEVYERFVNDLAADGLLNKNAYAIEHKDGKLIIDGKEQPAAVYTKYRSFLEQQKNIRITKNEDGLNIRKD